MNALLPLLACALLCCCRVVCIIRSRNSVQITNIDAIMQQRYGKLRRHERKSRESPYLSLDVESTPPTFTRGRLSPGMMITGARLGRPSPELGRLSR